MSEYTWQGRDGQTYSLSTVTDSHLRFYHRMMMERFERSNGMDFQLQEECDLVDDELLRRKLEPLPVRHMQKQLEDKMWRDERARIRQEHEIQRQQEYLLKAQQRRQELEQLNAAIAKEKALTKQLRGEQRRLQKEYTKQLAEEKKQPEVARRIFLPDEEEP